MPKVLVGDPGDQVDIRNITVRISERFKVNRAGVFFDRVFDFLRIMGVYECRADPVLREGMFQQVEASAVDRFLCDDMAAVCGKGLDRIGNSSRT